MELVLGFEEWGLDALSTEHSVSPEEFIDVIEQQLESGELSESEAIALARDFFKR